MRSVLLVGLCMALPCRAESSSYREVLEFQPLPRENLLASFTFETEEAIPSIRNNTSHYNLFPRSLGRILDQASTASLHLRFSQGWWDDKTWGSLPRNGSMAGGIGVEVWAWITSDSYSSAQQKWISLVNNLSGLFCASLNFLDGSQTSHPQRAFQHASVGGYLFRGALPREPVCTENLTPFIKLLPCKGRAGISSLLDGHKLFDAQWQSMSLDVDTLPDKTRKLTQAIDILVNVQRANRKAESPIPAPPPFEQLNCDYSGGHSSHENSCFPIDGSTDISWSIRKIFGKDLAHKCPLATNSEVVKVHTPASWTLTKEIQGEKTAFKANGDVLHDHASTEIIIESNDASNVLPVDEPPVYVQRSLSGHGQDSGGLRTVFENPSMYDSVRFLYYETLPWFMRIYVHTLQLHDSRNQLLEDKSEILKNILYRPAIDRLQPSQLEFELDLPPKSRYTLSYDFDKSLLYIEEYPPDPNRGFDLSPGVLTTIPDPMRSTEHKPYTIRTSSSLLTLPTPDFSMPYNVIILTGTVMALAFGTIFNLLVKRVVTDTEAAQNTILSVGFRNLKQLFHKKSSS